MPDISTFQLQELVTRTRTVLNAANEGAEDGTIPESAADLVEEQLAPVFTAAEAALQATVVPDPEPEPEPVITRRRY